LVEVRGISQHGAAALTRRLTALVAVVVFGAVLFFAPFGMTWPCMMRVAFHVPCPTCGMTRATRLIAHGDVAGATQMHPLWFLVLPLAMGIIVLELEGYVRTGRWGGAARIPALRWLGLVTVILLVLVWIARFFGAFGGPAPV
jgi:hypothetical protein